MPPGRLRTILVAALIALSGVGLFGLQQRGQPLAVATTGTAFVAGQVVELPSGRPVAGATVALAAAGRGGPPRPPVIADSQGRFFFGNVVAGSYATQVIKPGYAPFATAGVSWLLAVNDGERITDVRVRLVKLASLSGTVRDDGGDPVVGTDVMAFRRATNNGRPLLLSAGRSRTDDRGQYRLFSLQPGDYYVCACSRDAIPFDGVLLTTLASEPMQLMGVAARALKAGADVAALDSTLRTFAPTFYPSGTSVARATRLTLTSGEERAATDITVTATRATRVSGVVTGASSPVIASSIRLVPAFERDEAAAITYLSPVLVQPDGRFDFVGVPPGQYVLRVFHTVFAGRGGPSGSALAFVGVRGADLGQVGSQLDEPPLWAIEPVTVGDDGVTGLTVALRRGTKISGRLQFAGASTPPAAQLLARVVVLTAPMSGDPSRGGQSGIGRVTADGTFEIRGLVPGRYAFDVIGLQGWPTLKSVVLAGQDITDAPIDVGATDLSDLVFTFSDAPLATLSGAVAGDLRDDLLVVAFPTDRRIWAEPAAASRRFRTVAVGRTGQFSITGIPAGEYFLIVVPDEGASTSLDSSKFDTLSRGAQRVQLGEGDKKIVSVRR